MGDEERVRWATSGGASIAYRTIGDGPIDLLFLPGILSHIEVVLEEPGVERFYRRLSRAGRVVLMDRRGSGLSDPVSGSDLPLATEVTDIEAVLDDLGTDRAVLFAYTTSASLAVTFAVRRPERTLALLLYGAQVVPTRDEEAPWALTREERDAQIAATARMWGTGETLDLLAPGAADQPQLRTWLGRLERLSMTPRGFEEASRRFSEQDVRGLLPHIRVPTLLLHRTDDQLIDVRHARLAATRIPGARLVELPGSDSLPMLGDTEALTGEILEFLTGGRVGREPERRLLTVLFTDVVDATGHAARLGDSRWRDLLAAHDARVRRELERFGGREVKTVGDAFLATWEGAPSPALRCAQAIRRAVRELGIEVRAGLHTGECEVLGDDVGGMAVHIAARVAALASADEVLASGTAYGTVVGSGLEFTARGDHELKGVPGRWPLFALEG
ncbi:adenylate/guanylate cyclase domain-containing protein [Conexibacter sp. SYSU D00693]|uniref:adenylate/guanylate cyclase domain-containing protein n=1 Tax=Conexibacter sp. SYSU D00693 TaxID=2812560 RepID=UPI00196B8373|nr:adenylate/guanylate cyclase domain-containing protein [Conexibacter sp. SYSU D00693]